MLVPGELCPAARLVFALAWEIRDAAPTVRSVLGLEMTRAHVFREWRESWARVSTALSAQAPR